MKTEIFIVTYHKDFQYLKYCLRSIAKFTTGFSGVTILVPDSDKKGLMDLFLSGYPPIPFTLNIKSGEEWHGKGFLWHACQIFRADEWCPDADFIAHFDPDCIFTEPVTPDTFIKDGKPIIQFESFRTIGIRHPGVLRWKDAAENCLPFPVEAEFMRQHPETYHRGLYGEARRLIEDKVKMNVDDYIRGCVNEFPMTFAEFPTLGAVAKARFPDKYQFVDNAKKSNPDRGDFPTFQAWSHSPPDKPCELWHEGRPKIIVPMEMYAKLGLT